jgi:hypothetical protein
MTDFRALCAELVEKLDELNCNFNIPNQSALIERAYEALAQPEPQGPTDEELMDMAEFYIEDNGSLGLHNAGDFARAVLARWGNR